ncbi:MAG: hypothetical protein COU27_01810 [Candidatus Levybacteria bacterium CG10_big_fil_rev_8_21_14_0_10_36_7]|nr:MAG: hypothetical protein COU27_01810 [Candidatus Levybacteria bacterium CG10_big_fil_rev_8_21_14_0_10_36_7]
MLLESPRRIDSHIAFAARIRKRNSRLLRNASLYLKNIENEKTAKAKLNSLSFENPEHALPNMLIQIGSKKVVRKKAA